MKKILLPIMISTFATLSVQALTTSVVELEKAIFLQENKKDYKAAADIFARVLAESKKEDIETLYRLSQCQKQLGQTEKYLESITELSKHEEQNNKWVQLALEEKKEAVIFLKPLWEDGDVLTYDELDRDKKFSVSYSKLPDISAWKVEFSGSRDQDKKVFLYRDSDLQPMFAKGLTAKGWGVNTKDHIENRVTDLGSFYIDFVSRYVRTLPLDYTKREVMIVESGVLHKMTIYRTKNTKNIITSAGEFECSQIVVDATPSISSVNQFNFWVNTKGKREVVRMHTGDDEARSIDLITIGKRKG